IFEAVKAADGEFSIWHYKEGRVTLLRDSVGTRPLFYGVNKNFFAFSSVKDALHRLGIMNITSLKPGDALIYDGKMKIDTCNPLSTPSFSLEPTSLLKDELKEAVLRSVEKRVKGVKKVGVLFSSGVDSALIAHLAKNFDSELFLYCTGTESCEDVRCASQFAKKIGLDVEPITLSEEQVIEYYKKLRSLLPSSELMRIELAIPIFICSEHAKKDGVRVLLSGQGAEELFVGYDRYVQCFRRGGNLRKMLFEELKALHSKDLENNWYVASMNQCQLRYPFLDTEVIRVATSIKPEFNLKGGKKVVLREISKEMGLPPEISGRPKKAVQYGSGIHKTLIRALRKGLV
ncbi:MAG: asparagine synthetase B, partial [Candidatus Micrarchaeia archaeon]